MAANEILAVLMFLSFIALVFSGFPVAWLLGGLAVIFSALALDFSETSRFTSLLSLRAFPLTGTLPMMNASRFGVPDSASPRAISEV